MDRVLFGVEALACFTTSGSGGSSFICKLQTCRWHRICGMGLRGLRLQWPNSKTAVREPRAASWRAAVLCRCWPSKSFTVTVQNNDSSSCSAGAFNLASTMPDPSWGATFGAASLQVAPGQQGQTTLTVSVPNPYALGTYPTSATATRASDAAYNGTGNTNVTVTEPTYRLTASVSGRGTMGINPPNVSCRGNCTQSYPSSSNTQVTLTATPDRGYSFSGWSGACAGTQSTCSVTMSSDKAVTASFTKIKGGR